MAAPLVAMAGVAIISGIAQWMNSEKAREATAQERAQMQRLLNDIQDPNFDYSRIDPATYSVVAKYVPEVAPYVAEANPTLVLGQSEDAQLGAQAQREALEKYRSMAATGEDPAAAVARDRSMRRVAADSQGRAGAIEQSFARRGMGGSGMEFLQQLVEQQGAGMRATEASESALMEAQRTRLEAIRAGAGLGGAMQDRELRTEGQNAGILNDFNARTRNNMQSWGDNAAGIRNDGQRFNITNAQDVANRNESARYQGETANLDRQNGLAQQKFNNDFGKVTGQNAVSAGVIADTRGNAQDRNAAIGGAASGAQSAISYSSRNNGQAAKPEDEDPNDPLKRKY